MHYSHFGSCLHDPYAESPSSASVPLLSAPHHQGCAAQDLHKSVEGRGNAHVRTNTQRSPTDATWKTLNSLELYYSFPMKPHLQNRNTLPPLPQTRARLGTAAVIGGGREGRMLSSHIVQLVPATCWYPKTHPTTVYNDRGGFLPSGSSKFPLALRPPVGFTTTGVVQTSIFFCLLWRSLPCRELWSLPAVALLRSTLLPA